MAAPAVAAAAGASAGSAGGVGAGAGAASAGAGAAAVSGGLSIFSSILNNAVNWKLQQEQRQFTRETNQKNIDLMHEAWARDDTARQRMVQDLEAAGLSKWLAAGASPMSSSPISVGTPQQTYKSDFDFGSAMDKALSAYQNVQYIEQTKAQTQNIRDQNRLLQAQIQAENLDNLRRAHDVVVFSNRKDVASTDPASMRMISELLNQVQNPESAFRNTWLGNLIFGGSKNVDNSDFETTSSSGEVVDLPFERDFLEEVFGKEGLQEIINEAQEKEKKKKSKKTYQQEADENEAALRELINAAGW